MAVSLTGKMEESLEYSNDDKRRDSRLVECLHSFRSKRSRSVATYATRSVLDRDARKERKCKKFVDEGLKMGRESARVLSWKCQATINELRGTGYA